MNLAFLCFEHHDEYDSVPSQRKGFREPEVVYYRDELYGSTSRITHEPLQRALSGMSTEEEKLRAVQPLVDIRHCDARIIASDENVRALLISLLASAQGWYDEIVDGIAALQRERGEFPHRPTPLRLGFTYVWRRRYLPNVLAIADALAKRVEMAALVAEIQEFISLLTRRDTIRSLHYADTRADTRDAALSV